MECERYIIGGRFYCGGPSLISVPVKSKYPYPPLLRYRKRWSYVAIDDDDDDDVVSLTVRDILWSNTVNTSNRSPLPPLGATPIPQPTVLSTRRFSLFSIEIR